MIDDSSEDPEVLSFEVHLQEGFTGQLVEICAGGRVLAQVLAATRFQTGLAGIETLDLTDGTVITVRVSEMNLESDISVGSAEPFITVALGDGRLVVNSQAVRPGYV